MSGQATIKKTGKVHGLCGLIVCGGKSKRMGTDKSMLVYYDKPHCYYLYEMLESFCEKVFISCNIEQQKNISTGYPTIADLPAFYDIGPMTSLLSAFSCFDDKDFVIIGCDYPFLTSMDVRSFLSSFNRTTQTAAFYNSEAGLYEPLLAYFNKSSAKGLFKMHANKEYALQFFLKKNHAVKFFPANLKSIKSVNTAEEFLEAKALIGSIVR